MKKNEEGDNKIENRSLEDDIFRDEFDINDMKYMDVKGSELLEGETYEYDMISGEEDERVSVYDFDSSCAESSSEEESSLINIEDVDDAVMDEESEWGEKQRDEPQADFEDDEEKDPTVTALKNKIADRKRKRLKRLNRKRIFLSIAAGLTLMIILSFTPFFTVDRIDVEGNSYFSDDEIIYMSHAKPGQNLIYSPGKIGIKKYLKSNPYIESVRVKRSLPSTLLIVVKEREQLAAVPYSDEFVVIDKNGTVLRRTTDPPELTIIRGIRIKKMDKGEGIEAENSDILKHSMNILNAMKEGKLFFKGISVDTDVTKVYIYDKLVLQGAYSDVYKMIDKGRLQEILNMLFERGIKRGKITVSTNGYASYSPEIQD